MSADLGRLAGRRCGVVGRPIAHSLSPVLHTAAYRELGLDWEYKPYEITETELDPFLSGLDESWRGVSVTMPLKREAWRLVEHPADGVAEDLGVVNTIVLADDSRAMRGYNTDVDGFVAALREHGVEFVGDVIVVGGGATAASALVSVRRLGGLAARVAVRDPDKARTLVDLGFRHALDTHVFDLDDIEQIPAASVLVSTIPAHAQPAYAERLVERADVVFDVVYDPARTPLIEAAQRAGKTAIGGFDLLLHQAVRQLELMTACETAPVEAMRKAGLAALGNR
jgi:shikimate dehydrogenase